MGQWVIWISTIHPVSMLKFILYMYMYVYHYVVQLYITSYVFMLHK